MPSDTIDLEPLWLQFENGANVVVNEDAMFDLQVRVEKRNSDVDIDPMPMSFESKFFLSVDSQLDDGDDEVFSIYI